MTRREYKIVVLGSMGAGKSTLVRALANGAVVDTDVMNTDLGSDKLATTVAMDFADIELPNGDRLRLYGTPGQKRFDFIWPIILQGASGVAILIDATEAAGSDGIGPYLKVLSESASGVPAVIGLTKIDQCKDFDLQQYQLQHQISELMLPIIPFDAREPEQILMIMDVLMGEIEAESLVEAHG